jgi:hypothetical protein
MGATVALMVATTALHLPHNEVNPNTLHYGGGVHLGRVFLLLGSPGARR